MLQVTTITLKQFGREECKTVFVDRNAMLKLKFQRLHSTVISNVNAADIIDFLFQQRVLGPQDARTLHQKSNPQQQCRDLLMLLHTSENPQAFVHLYDAIKNEPRLHWLIDRINKYSDQSVIDLLPQLDISEVKGKRLFHPVVTVKYEYRLYHNSGKIMLVQSADSRHVWYVSTSCCKSQ